MAFESDSSDAPRDHHSKPSGVSILHDAPLLGPTETGNGSRIFSIVYLAPSHQSLCLKISSVRSFKPSSGTQVLCRTFPKVNPTLLCLAAITCSSVSPPRFTGRNLTGWRRMPALQSSHCSNRCLPVRYLVHSIAPLSKLR